MIIVEGPDGAGKSTLVEMMTRKLLLPQAPRVVSKDAQAMVDIKAWVEENVKGGFQRTIFDRHRLVSEFIYGPLLRRKQEEGFDDIEWVNEMLFRLYALRPIIVYCLPPLGEVKKNLKNDENNRVVRSKIPQMYTLYAHRIGLDMIAHGHRTLLYDYTQDRADEIIIAVRSLLDEERKSHRGNHPHR